MTIDAPERALSDDGDDVFEALDQEVWIAEDDAGMPWSGTRYWCVAQDYRSALKDGAVPHLVAMCREQLGDAVEIEPARLLGHDAYVVAFGVRLHRVFVRPDGEHVVLNVAFLRGIEKMLQTEDEFGEPMPRDYRMVQCGGPLRPVVYLDPDKNMLAIIMPVKTG